MLYRFFIVYTINYTECLQYIHQNYSTWTVCNVYSMMINTYCLQYVQYSCTGSVNCIQCTCCTHFTHYIVSLPKPEGEGWSVRSEHKAKCRQSVRCTSPFLRAEHNTAELPYCCRNLYRPYWKVISCVDSGTHECTWSYVNPLNAELNPICYLLALLGA